jgi:DNA-binding transcriptional ArsR family regulator
LCGRLGRITGIIPVVLLRHFGYDRSVDVDSTDPDVSSIAAAIGEPARARILYCLLDGRARTSTELAMVAEIRPSTASAHLDRLRLERLVKVTPQGKHRYYSLSDGNVATALEALTVLAGASRRGFVPTAPSGLRAARTCYDHIAGAVGVSLHDRFQALGWLSAVGRGAGYDLTARGESALTALGIDVEAARKLRRRFAYPCVDWSERRPHIGGAIGAAVLELALKRRWVVRDLDSRALTVSRLGEREMFARFGLRI